MLPASLPESEVVNLIQIPDSTGMSLLQNYRQMVVGIFYAENS